MSIHVILMGILSIAGLAIFEIVNSLDNAIVNSQVLAKIKSQKAKRFFLTWGLFFSVFLVRGVVPLIIFYIPNRHLGFAKVMQSFWNGDPAVHDAVEAMAPNLLMAGGMFLGLLFLNWFLVEEKEVGYKYEHWFSGLGQSCFNGCVGIILITIGMLAKTQALLFSAVIGVSAFFLIAWIKGAAEAAEEKILADNSSSSMGDWGKVLFLEAIDTSFSIDGVVGAFAFTMFIPFILIGNGLGAYIVRALTISGVERIGKYKWLANGAFYSIGALGLIMMLDGFQLHIPEWLSPVVTFTLVGFFLFKSIRHNRSTNETGNPAPVATKPSDVLEVA